MPQTGTLTKAHIIDAVAVGNGFTRKKTNETVETVLELIKQAFPYGRGRRQAVFSPHYCTNPNFDEICNLP